MKIVLTGATGFAGGEVIRQALADPEIDRITVLTRRPVGVVHPRLNEIILDDFLDYSGVDLSDHDACIWCLGVSQTQVGEEEYIRITLGYAAAAARAMYAANPHLRFCFVSGRSADPSEGRTSLFARIKGRTERILAELGGPLFVFRPGYIRPTTRSGPHKDLARLFAPVGTFISFFSDDFSVDCDQLARCLLDVAKHGADKSLLTNSEIRRWPRVVGASKPRSRSKIVRTLAWSGLTVVTLLVAVIGAVLITGCAAFGDKPSGDRLIRIQQSPQWHDDHFENPQPMWADSGGAWRAFLFGPSTTGSTPESPILVVRNDASAYAHPPASGMRLTWFGHASTLLEIDGTTVLIDPLWSERASPVSWAGPKRWYPPPMALNDLPKVDVVLISHDHVDHLDYQTVVAMKPWKAVFVVPLGIGAHLSRWGIPDARIVELDWWESMHIGALELVATPSRHASGRLQSKSNRTLWAGWAIVGPRHRVWYSGDTGFHEALAAIGERFGPFDLTLIEAGQYDANWLDTHLGPELAVEAHRLVRGNVLVPVHWALIKQAPHAWTEPIERVLAAARCRGVQVLAPRPGEIVESFDAPRVQAWWPQLPWRTAAQYPVLATRRGFPSDRVSAPPCIKVAG